MSDPTWYTKVGETFPSRRDGVYEPNVYERRPSQDPPVVVVTVTVRVVK